MRVIVEWDLEVDGRIEDDPEVIPPELMIVPDDVPHDMVSDYLSDQTGWLVTSWKEV